MYTSLSSAITQSLMQSITSLFLTVAPSASNYDNVLTKLNEIAATNPSAAQVITIGVNDQGTPIKGLKIGNGATNSLVVGTHHGNEFGSTAVALGLAADLASHPIKDQTVYVIPVLNVTGYNRNVRNETGIQANGSQISVDPNRDYPGPCKSDKAYKLKSTKSLAQFLEDKNIQISATLHTYWPAVVYPWGISTKDLSTPYDDTYKQLVSDATQESHYQTGNNTQVLYAADGTFEDYAYAQDGIWSLLFELGTSHTPSTNAVQGMIDQNTPGLRRFLENAPKTRVTEHKFTGRCDYSKSMRRIFPE